MNKNTKIIVGLSVMLLVGSEMVQAQMINYNRRNKNIDAGVIQNKTVSKPQVTQRIETPKTTQVVESSNQYVSTRAQAVVEENLPKVQNRLEGYYDQNEDGVLQQSELQDFYSYIVATVERRGSMRVSSDILKPFDANADGKISSYEVRQIKNVLN